MYCAKCGAELPEGAKHCPNCGASVENTFDTDSNYNGVRMLKTDRSLLVFILLNIITCGIYTFFFIHSIAKDVNEACVNDSEKTSGVGMFILMWIIAVALGTVFGLLSGVDVQTIVNNAQAGNYTAIVNITTRSVIPSVLVSMVTGIYPLYWRYKLGDKLQRNGQKYGLMIPENGSTIIMWDVIGIICCCFCSWYALYIVIKNTNFICTAYNNRYVLNRDSE